MTKKCNFHFPIFEACWKRTFFLLLFVCLFSSLLFSQDTETPSSDSSEEIPSWIIASLPFSFSQKRDLSASENAIATEIPSLILGQLSGGLMRQPDKEELTDRQLYELRQERQSLFLQISSENQKRDSYVLGNYSARELAVNIKESEKKLAELRGKIDENILKTENLRNGVVENNKKNRKNKDEKKDTEERVQLYQNDVAQLLKNDDGLSVDSFEFSENVSKENINAVITGLITIHGSYVSCATELYVFPGARVIGTASEIGRSDNLSAIAHSIAEQLQPSITAQLPVRLVFSVFPEDAREVTSLIVDDVVYPTVPESVLIHSGIHTILFSSEKFMRAGTTYAFTESSSYAIDVTLTPVSFGTAFLNVISGTKNLLDVGTVYLNAEKIESQSSEENRVGITINGRPVLGEFVTEDGSAALFYVSEKNLNSGQELSVKVKAYDRSDVIEKRRKYTYIAYSLFIISLIPTFYTYGNFDMERLAYASGRGNYDTAVRWQQATWVSAGISIGAAAFWVYHLVRYLIAANKVLPADAKQVNGISKNSNKLSF